MSVTLFASIIKWPNDLIRNIEMENSSFLTTSIPGILEEWLIYISFTFDAEIYGDSVGDVGGA